MSYFHNFPHCCSQFQVVSPSCHSEYNFNTVRGNRSYLNVFGKKGPKLPLECVWYSEGNIKSLLGYLSTSSCFSQPCCSRFGVVSSFCPSISTLFGQFQVVSPCHGSFSSLAVKIQFQRCTTNMKLVTAT